MDNLYMALSGRFGASKNLITRPATWTDLIYIAAEKAVENKFVMTSRYPIEDFYGIMYTKARIMSTTETTTATIDGVDYKFYPVVRVGQDSSNFFVNTMSPCNVYLKGMGGDYDGDSTPSRGLFTDEANANVAEFIKDKKNFVNLVGQNIRTTERDFVQSLYSLSKPPTEIKLEDLN